MNTDDTNGQQQAPETALAKYRDEGFNIIAADDKIHVTSPAHRVDYASIQVHPDPSRAEVYKVGSVPVGNGKFEDRFGLSASVLNRIALAASIVWDPDKTGPDRKTMTREYLLYEAVGYMTTPAGETMSYLDPPSFSRVNKELGPGTGVKTRWRATESIAAEAPCPLTSRR